MKRKELTFESWARDRFGSMPRKGEREALTQKIVQLERDLSNARMRLRSMDEWSVARVEARAAWDAAIREALK